MYLTSYISLAILACANLAYAAPSEIVIHGEITAPINIAAEDDSLASPPAILKDPAALRREGIGGWQRRSRKRAVQHAPENDSEAEEMVSQLQKRSRGNKEESRLVARAAQGPVRGGYTGSSGPPRRIREPERKPYPNASSGRGHRPMRGKDDGLPPKKRQPVVRPMGNASSGVRSPPPMHAIGGSGQRSRKSGHP